MSQSHSDPETGKRTRRFRWRVLPATLLIVFGGALILVGLASLGFAAFSVFHTAIPLEQARYLAGQGLTLFGGVLWIAAGNWCLQGRWWRAIIGAIAGYLYLVSIQFIASPAM